MAIAAVDFAADLDGCKSITAFETVGCACYWSAVVALGGRIVGGVRKKRRDGGIEEAQPSLEERLHRTRTLRGHSNENE
jgi:hypothetical protein